MEIVVDLMFLVGFYDIVVVVSGDGDLVYVVDVVSYWGVCIEVVSFCFMISDSLINVFDCYVDFDSIKEEI